MDAGLGRFTPTKEFVKQVMEELCKIADVERSTTKGYDSHANGPNEKSMCVIYALLACRVSVSSAADARTRRTRQESPRRERPGGCQNCGDLARKQKPGGETPMDPGALPPAHYS
ncbi:unnamed protein product [Heligmosomoides polygyrus]|uniref:Integrase catalytic domain-containing protein n=1 Tax=Heligmosomoides polygyrus TaxID=6339 RepID=A0A183FQF4_HELPZ|nr:unnamed protein product [Heligmosomoides polygyrus]